MLNKTKETQSTVLTFARIMQFSECPRCFYLNKKEGLISPAPPISSTLFEISKLIRDELNNIRKRGAMYSVFKKNKVDASFYNNQQLISQWREMPGITYFDSENNLKYFGLIDDLLLSKQKKMIIVDFKITSSGGIQEVSLHNYSKGLSYQRWLLEKNGYSVENYGYILRFFPKKIQKPIGKGLIFSSEIIKVNADYKWIDKITKKIKGCLNLEYPPVPADDCGLCKFSNYKFDNIIELINQGETNRREFKSSLRWDYKENRLNPELERVVAITISAFMNTEGGELLIGISDEGNILGIQKDIKTIDKKNKDGFAIRLGQVIDMYLGKYSNNYLVHEFREIKNQTICLIKVEKSKNPIYCGDEFYIRSVAQNRKCNSRESGEYINKHFANQE